LGIEFLGEMGPAVAAEDGPQQHHQCLSVPGDLLRQELQSDGALACGSERSRLKALASRGRTHRKFRHHGTARANRQE
jgi:hypothetical protein